MYKCQICNKSTPPTTRCCRLVLKIREKIYPRRPKSNKGYSFKDGDSVKSNKSRDKMDDYGGKGWEIVHEINCCPKCFEEYKEKHAKTE